MDPRLIVALETAFIPLVIGFIWYHPKAFGSVVRPAGENAKMGHMALVALITYIGGFYIARSLGAIVIHQYGLLSMLANQPDVHVDGTPLNTTVQGLLDKYGDNFRTFKHGAYHGFYAGLYFALPIVAIITVFERKKWTHIAVHGIYWIICLTLMGGVVCAYMPPVHITLAK